MASQGFCQPQFGCLLWKIACAAQLSVIFPGFLSRSHLGNPRTALQDIRTANNGPARVASDHLPVVATVNLSPARPISL
jgi:hypothetical protein